MERRKKVKGGARAGAANALGLYADLLDEGERTALALAADCGIEQELSVVRVLIRRALIEGRPTREVAGLVDCLARLLKTQHVLKGKAAKQLDEALAAALDAIAAEMGAAL
ncbi:MAG: hypothetical protein ACYC3S_18225 [Chloroflexota bacterium]